MYQLDLRGGEATVRLESEITEFLAIEPDETTRNDPEVRSFARRLIVGTHQAQAEIDSMLVRIARNWDVRRMAVIDRNILRVAIYELLHCHDIPPKVSINEAIELGKRFSTANSGAFINGILDRVHIDFEKQRGETGVTAPEAEQSEASTSGGALSQES